MRLASRQACPSRRGRLLLQTVFLNAAKHAGRGPVAPAAPTVATVTPGPIARPHFLRRAAATPHSGVVTDALGSRA
ncbi:MAG: hypothetical protein JSS27_09710 [Planctomycetes bacterium]|nr:hypothetical protein [Planctomycetota bacterium]